MVILHRLFFALTLVVGIVFYFCVRSLSPEDYRYFVYHVPGIIIYVLFSLGALFYGYTLCFSVYDMFSKQRRPILGWFFMTIVLSMLGTYIYFEKFILGTYFKEDKPPG